MWVVYYPRLRSQLHGCTCLLVISRPNKARLARIARASKIGPRLLKLIHQGFTMGVSSCEDDDVQIVNHSKNEGKLHSVARTVVPVVGGGTVCEDVHVCWLALAVRLRKTYCGQANQ